jgi:hypothetical protein
VLLGYPAANTTGRGGNVNITFDFPREVLELSTEKGRGFRRLVNNEQEFEKYWLGKNGVSNAYMTVYGYRATEAPNHRRVNLQTPIIRHFVLDFDPKNFRDRSRPDVTIDVPLEQTLRLHHYLLKEDIEHGIWYSGGGFHIWVALSETYSPGDGGHLSAIKEAGMQLVNDWIKEFNLYCSDPAVPFDTSGLIRIPNSYNAKRGYWSVPLTTDDLEQGVDHVMEKALDPCSGTITYGTKGVVLQVRKPEERLQIFNPNSTPIDLPIVQIDGLIVLPCLNTAACQLGGNPSHDARVQLVKYLAKRLRNFMPLYRFSPKDLLQHTETIVDFIKGLQWADFDEGITRYQVGTVVGKDYPQTCKMLWQKGHCLGKCRYWDKTGSIEGEQNG